MRCGARISTVQPSDLLCSRKSHTALLASPVKRKRTVRLPLRVPPELLSRRKDRGIGKSLGKRGCNFTLEEKRPGSRSAWVALLDPPARTLAGSTCATPACRAASAGRVEALAGEPMYTRQAAHPKMPVAVAHSQRLCSQAQSVSAS